MIFLVEILTFKKSYKLLTKTEEGFAEGKLSKRLVILKYSKDKIHSKGFYKESTLQDFPIRVKNVSAYKT